MYIGRFRVGFCGAGGAFTGIQDVRCYHLASARVRISPSSVVPTPVQACKRGHGLREHAHTAHTRAI